MRLFTLNLWLVLFATAAHPATFLKIDGIPGDAQDQNHRKEIIIASFQLTGKTLSFTKKIDVASPLLLLHTANGRHISNAVLTDSPEKDERLYTFTDVVITGVSQRAGTSTVEQVTFNFASVKIVSSAQPKDARQLPQTQTPASTPSTTRSSASTGQSVQVMIKADGMPALMDPRALQWGILNSSGGQAQFQPFDVQKGLDASSDRLMQVSVEGRHIQLVIVHLRSGSTNLLTYTLRDVQVLSYSRSSSGETFRLQYAEIEVEAPASPQGNVPGKYNLKGAKV